MRIVSNERLIRRNAKIGQYATLGGLIAVFAGIYVLVRFPQNLTSAMIPVILGFFLSQVGFHFTSRWGNRPRPDEVVDRALKGLPREYGLYHYVTPATHLLVGPAGIWVLLPYHQAGTIYFDRKRWRLKGGGFSQSYLRFFGGDGLGRPDLDVEAETTALRSHLQRLLPEGSQLPEIKSVLLFTNPKAELKTEGAPVTAMLPKDLKDFIRNAARSAPLPGSMLANLQAVLPQPDQPE
jgi:hypothetical protein